MLETGQSRPGQDSGKKEFRMRPIKDTGDKERALLALKERFEETYADQPFEVLASRLKELDQNIEEAQQELKLRNLATGGKDTSAMEKFNKAVGSAFIERMVIQELLPAQGEVIALSPDTTRSEVVDRTIAVEAARERAEVKAQRALDEGAKMDRLVEDTRQRSGATIDQALQRDAHNREARIKASQAASRYGMTHEVSFDPGKKPVEVVAKTQERIDPYATMSARVRPESFWSRFKRSVFGSGDTALETAKAEEKRLDERLKQTARDVQVQKPKPSIETQRGLVSDRVLSARKKQETEPSFFQSLWKRISGQSKREERAATYAKNLEKIGKHQEYVLNPTMVGRERMPQSKDVMLVEDEEPEIKKVANG